MLLAGALRWPTWMYFASRVISSASRTTSFGIVAEKSSVWRTAGMAVMMRRTSGQKPMSIMRSASSRMSSSMPLRSAFCCRMWSISRPGVATMMSTPAFSARSCMPISTPP